MGENKQVTIMVLKVDLQCEKCYRKVKKVLCKFPQIRDQMYDEKNNQVIIKVVCCNPEKIRDKLCCKGRCVITSIDIIERPQDKPSKDKSSQEKPSKDKPSKDKPSKDKPSQDKPSQEKPSQEKPSKDKPSQDKPSQDKPSQDKPSKDKPSQDKPPPVPCTCPPVPCICPPVTCTCPPVTCTCPPVTCTCPPVICRCPPVPPSVKCPRPPVNTCCTECYGGHPGGPCQTGYGYGVRDRYRQYDGYCGRPVYDSYGGWRSYNTSSYCVTRPDCFSEENPQTCAIM